MIFHNQLLVYQRLIAMASYIANISHSFFLYLLVFHSYVSLPIKKKQKKNTNYTKSRQEASSWLNITSHGAPVIDRQIPWWLKHQKWENKNETNGNWKQKSWVHAVNSTPLMGIVEYHRFIQTGNLCCYSCCCLYLCRYSRIHGITPHTAGYIPHHIP